jgi:hypothetical protein
MWLRVTTLVVGAYYGFYWLRANLSSREQVLQDTLVEMMMPHPEVEDIVVVEGEASTSRWTLNSG